jgi:hypothetical protein
MLARKNYILLGVQAFVAIGLLSGCIINETTTGAAGTGGTSATTTTGTTATTGTGGDGGSGVGGGTTSTTGTGGSACIGETGKGVLADCDGLNITPVSHGGAAHSSCGATLDQDPPGYGLCTRGFTLFNPGAATTLVECLATIGVQDECNTEPLQVCIDKMFKEECDIASIATACEGIKSTCGADPFDAAKCAVDLNPFSDAGLNELSDCINATDPAVSCQKAYDDCYTQVFTF